jgi:hypothetical protein
MVTCKPMWQNMQTYQITTNNHCPQINAKLLLVSVQYSSAITHKLNVLGHYFLVLVCGTGARNLSATFSYTMYLKFSFLLHMKNMLIDRYTPPTFWGLRRAFCMLHTGFLLDTFFDPEYGAYMSLRKVSWLSTEYTVFYPRKDNSRCEASS